MERSLGAVGSFPSVKDTELCDRCRSVDQAEFGGARRSTKRVSAVFAKGSAQGEHGLAAGRALGGTAGTAGMMGSGSTRPEAR